VPDNIVKELSEKNILNLMKLFFILILNTVV